MDVQTEERQMNNVRCDWSDHDHTDLQEARECWREQFIENDRTLQMQTTGDRRVVPVSDPTGWWEQCSCSQLFIQTDGAPDAYRSCSDCYAELRARLEAEAHDCGKGEWCPQYGAAFKASAERAAAAADPYRWWETGVPA